MKCECKDPLCPVCQGDCEYHGTEVLYRVDMVDAAGTIFCEACADDAFRSGLYYNKVDQIVTICRALGASHD